MYNNEQRYYKVVCKCGHVGRKNYIPIAFAVIAENARDAANKARYLPRVKHQHKDAVLEVDEISYEEYQQLWESNDKDLYLKCESRQEQNVFCDLVSRIKEDTHYIDYNAIKKINREKRKERIGYILKKRAQMEETYNMEYLVY